MNPHSTATHPGHHEHLVVPARQQSPQPALDPAAVLVQASSRSWSGGSDRCMRVLDGKPLVLKCLERARSLFPGAQIALVAPAFDHGGLDRIGLAVENCRVSYGFDDRPLARLVAAVEDLPEDAQVLRVDGLHCFFRDEVVRPLLDAARVSALDIAKSPDDFPPALTGEVWRVGGLRELARVLASWPAERAAPHYVHPKFLAMRAETGLRAAAVEPPPIGDAVLHAIRQSLARAFDEDHIEVTGRSIAAGDQISFHYVLASRHLRPTDDVLDVASGNGFGGDIMARVARSVTCADLDAEKLAEGRAAFARPNLRFARENVVAMSFSDATFDVVVSLETIEHMDDVSGYLAELHRVLRPGGRAILSTPQNRIGRIPLTPAHVHEFSLADLKARCAARFEVERVIGLKAGTIYFEDDPVGANSVAFLRKAEC
jgi:2-polyprenyl-3-methyl-5-hydroxy-6-metoxy-1,4-benzoquinol methylase